MEVMLIVKENKSACLNTSCTAIIEITNTGKKDNLWDSVLVNAVITNLENKGYKIKHAEYVNEN